MYLSLVLWDGFPRLSRSKMLLGEVERLYLFRRWSIPSVRSELCLTEDVRCLLHLVPDTNIDNSSVKLNYYWIITIHTQLLISAVVYRSEKC